MAIRSRLREIFGARPRGRVVSVRSNRGGGGNQQLLRQLMDQYTSGASEARTAADQQYARLLDSVANLQQQVMGQLEGIGETGKKRIEQNLTKNQASTEQSLMDRGLFNTTVLDTMKRGNRSDADMATADLLERIAGMKAGAMMDLGRLKADSILSRQIQGPDQQFLQLISQLAAR